ncbi:MULTISPECIES: MarR family transcriptional regulator [Rhodomicrobium]|uniref:MarR family winged helix-turn-helix transcriptional regulator n=1 Tax=Rhodomicrobium TaxID=1068 RepID=UPI000B4A6853|nr:MULTISPECIES: MarR family transcriptional regulator [Rhodomicrobium]
MADINSRISDPEAAPERDRAEPLRQEDLYWYVEALFFAYRDFIGDPDRILDEIGFGRAHHRVLHFIHRYPGMRVADLLDILQITKQSLARVLRELIKEGYVAQHSGKSDRRERLLYVTDEGGVLARRLAAPQIEKLRAALGPLGKDGDAAVRRFLEAMIGPAEPSPRLRATDPFAEDGLRGRP